MRRGFLFSLFLLAGGMFEVQSNVLAAQVAPREPRTQRIVAIGDLHGDLDVALKALNLAGATDLAGNWIGGDLIVVQVGDQIDRGDNDRQILNLFAKLQEDARATGGQLISLLGNHEIMNVSGDFRYVTSGSFRDFAAHEPHSGRPIPRIPADQQARAAAFAPGGRYAQMLATRPVVAIVGDTVFVHGGLRREHVEVGLASLNQQVSAWMLGQTRRPALTEGSKSPLWMRDYSKGKPRAKTCDKLAAALRASGTKRMVVGHTVQDEGITTACNEQVWRIDIGLSGYYRHDLLQVLAIDGDEVHVLTGER